MPGITPPARMDGFMPYMRFVPNKEIQNAFDERRAAEERQQQPVIQGLSGYLDKLWERARSAKEPIQQDLNRSMRQCNGEYDPEKLQHIREQGGSEIYMMLTSIKRRAAASWLRETLIPDNDWPFEVNPTPISDLPPDLNQWIVSNVMAEANQASFYTEVAEQDVVKRLYEVRDDIVKRMQKMAEESSRRMRTKIKDQLVEGKWRTAMAEFIDDLTTFRAAILKGPILRRRKRLKWVQEDWYGQSQFKPDVGEEIVVEFERRSPYDIYPTPGATSIQDGGLFDRYRLTVGDLVAMKGIQGYDDAAIDAVIDEYGRGGLRMWLYGDAERAEQEGKRTEYFYSTDTIDALNYWGDVPGFYLLEWGMDPKKVPDRNRVYSVECWKIGRWTIKATVNPHPLGKRPYSKTSWIKVPGTFWGWSVPDVIRDDQEMCNASARAIANNMGLSSGPQISINDVTRVPDDEDVTDVWPWKVWQFGPDRMSQSHRPPIEFYQPSIYTAELLAVYDKFSQSADEHVGLPGYTHGETDRVGGAGRTASGLSMLLGQVSKNTKMVVSNVDIDVIEERIRDVYLFNMLHSPDPTIKGDAQVEAIGARTLFVKEQQQLRRLEFLQLTNNEVDLEIMGYEGRRPLLREIAKGLDMDIDKIVPDIEDDDPMVANFKRRLQMMESALKEAKQQLENRERQTTIKAISDERIQQLENQNAVEVAKLKADSDYRVALLRSDNERDKNAISLISDRENRMAQQEQTRAQNENNLKQVETNLKDSRERDLAKMYFDQQRERTGQETARKTKRDEERHKASVEYQAQQGKTLDKKFNRMIEEIAEIAKSVSASAGETQQQISLLGESISKSEQEDKDRQKQSERNRRLIRNYLAKTGDEEIQSLVDDLG